MEIIRRCIFMPGKLADYSYKRAFGSMYIHSVCVCDSERVM